MHGESIIYSSETLKTSRIVDIYTTKICSTKNKIAIKITILAIVV